MGAMPTVIEPTPTLKANLAPWKPKNLRAFKAFHFSLLAALGCSLQARRPGMRESPSHADSQRAPALRDTAASRGACILPYRTVP